MISAVCFLIAKLVRRQIEQPILRAIGLGLLTVAASSTSAKLRRQADYRCSGTNDYVEIVYIDDYSPDNSEKTRLLTNLAWVNLQDSGASCVLLFYFDIRDTVCIEYSPECWLLFPFKISSNKIIVYWDKRIDSKYYFEIVKAINKVGNNYKDKPFIILELVRLK